MACSQVFSFSLNDSMAKYNALKPKYILGAYDSVSDVQDEY